VGCGFESYLPCQRCYHGDNMGDSKKILTLSFVAAAFLVGFISSIFLELAGATFGAVARLTAQDAVRHGIPVLLGFGTFVFLQLHPRIRLWAEEVVVEIGKVVWPSRKETVAMTIVVCVMLLISGMFLGLFDFISSFVINLFLKA
jgi:preprotein translocase subunit SecE